MAERARVHAGRRRDARARGGFGDGDLDSGGWSALPAPPARAAGRAGDGVGDERGVRECAASALLSELRRSAARGEHRAGGPRCAQRARYGDRPAG